MRLTPDPDQEAAIERMVNEPTRAALNASQYGTGKTLVTVEVAGRLGGYVNLIAAPLFTKYSWEATIKQQYPNADVRHINSTKGGQEALEDMLDGLPGWYIIGREYLMTAKVAPRVQKASPNIDFFAYDECAKWSNRKSQGFRNMTKIKPGYKMALSATPYGNRFSGMYAISHWLWPRKYTRGYWRWAAQWCEIKEDYFAGTVVAGEKVPGAFVQDLPCYVRLEKDFGDPIEDQIVIELSHKERKIYDTFEKHLIVWLGENPLITKFPHTKRMRLRQMTLGEVSVDNEDDTVEFHPSMKSTKYEALTAFMDEHPDEAMLILTDSQKYARVVTQRLLDEGYRAAEWSGKVSETARHKIKQDFMDEQLDYIVATIPAIGEGVDGLQHRARVMVWLSRSDDNQLNMQAFRRLYRRGQERQVISVDIVARNTYDLGQLSNLIEQQLAVNRSLKK